LPVVVGGVNIDSGDVLVGDDDGVVVIPRLQLDQVIAKLADVRAAEAALEAKVKAGLEIPDFIEKILASDRITRVG
jgi:4-hydroxy-4-methyl-2-oxoglutarate aldolase